MKAVTQQYPEKTGSVKEVLFELKNDSSPFHLVMIHGIADSTDVWRETCAFLDTRFKSYQEMSLPWNSAIGDAIAYTPTPGEVLKKTWKDLPRGPKIILAHSFGANSLLQMAQIDPLEDVKAVFLLSVYSKSSFDAFNWDLFMRYVTDFDRFLRSTIDSRPRSRELSESAKDIIQEKVKEAYCPPSWVEFFILFSTTPGLDLSAFDMPVLIASGDQDFSIEKDDIKNFSLRFNDGTFHDIKGCGHSAMVENPSMTAKLIQDFLNQRKILCQQ